MADKRTVEVRIVGDATGYKKALAESEQASGKTGSVIHGVFTGIGLGATQLAAEGVGRVIDILGESSKAAREDEVVTARLTTALRDNVKGFTGTAEAMGAASAAARKLGFTDDEAKASLARLVTVTKDTRQSQQDLALAEDVARAKGIDLAGATDIVVKAQNGNVGALKKLGIIVPAVTTAVDALKAAHGKATPEQLKAAEAADRQATATGALAALQKSASGQAEAYAGTMQGSMAVAGAQVDEMMQKLGGTLNQVAAAVLPSVVAGIGVVGDAMGQLVASAQPLIDQAVQLGGQVLGALGGAFSAVAEAVKPLMPVIGQLISEDLSVLGDIVKGVAGFITGTLVPAFTAFAKQAIPVVQAGLAWLVKDVLPSVQQAIGFIVQHALPPLRSALEWIGENVLPKLSAAFDWIVKNVLPPLVEAFGWVAKNVLPALGQGFAFFTDTILPALSGALQGIAGVVGSVLGGIAGTVKTVVNAVIGGIDAMIGAINSVRFNIQIPNPLGGSFGFKFDGVNLPLIPKLHSGGIVPGSPGQDVLALLQAGERVLPASPAAAPTLQVTINAGAFTGTPAEARSFARMLYDLLQDEGLRRGAANG